MSLDPDTIVFSVYKHRTKKRVNVTVKPSVIHFKTREKWHQWEEVEYCTFGGAVFMDLTMNHLDAEDEDEELTVPFDHLMQMSSRVKSTMNMETIVICTHIPGQTYLESQRSLMPYDIVKKVNRTKIKNISHFTEVLKGLAENDEHQYILLETERTNVYVDLKKIAAQECLLREKFQDQIFAVPCKRRRLR
jgi:uncharacterized metal-binding protein YceD (DUF177 family)